MEHKEKKDIFDKIWSFFASVKLAVGVIIALALTSIIGTIIEQNVEPAANLKLLAKVFGDSSAPSVYNLFLKLGFMNMYHSWWFVSLLIMFCTTLIVCSIDRLPKTLRLINTPLRPLGEDIIKTLPIKKEFKVKTSVKIARDEILNNLTPLRFHALESTEENSIGFYSQKGKYTQLGFYIVHLSLLLIFIGAIIGAKFGFGGFLNLPEGRTSDVIYAGGGRTIPLGFTIKCNWYDTRYYRDSDTPQEFQSELVVIEDGREVLKKVIEVNSPLTYKGITFYQSSYGMTPDAVGEFILKVIPKNSEEKVFRLKPGGTFEIPDTNIRGTVVNFSPALTRDPETGRLFTYAEQMTNPAVAIEFSNVGKEKFTGWILKRYPETGILPDGSKIEFIDYWGVEYTGLQVSKDPGVGIIYLACIIMAIGLYTAFFMSHKKIWIKLSADGGFVRIIAGGSASKNRLSLEKDIERILSHAVKSIEGRSNK